jgi:hypothetical protein
MFFFYKHKNTFPIPSTIHLKTEEGIPSVLLLLTNDKRYFKTTDNDKRYFKTTNSDKRYFKITNSDKR